LRSLKVPFPLKSIKTKEFRWRTMNEVSSPAKNKKQLRSGGGKVRWGKWKRKSLLDLGSAFVMICLFWCMAAWLI